ncbi:MAG: hypothetical protein KAS94_02635 [Desulfobulbaceae bacterium]|nr:hypothetical protein [Desulfobulbaceae bacterium]
MDAVTYPDQAVIDFCADDVIPLRVQADAKPVSGDYNVKWTPTLITLGPDGKEHYRTVGFLEPQELIGRLLLGEGKYYFDNDKFPEALAAFAKILADYQGTAAVPEAIYLQGVCQYKNSGDPMPLKAAYELLEKDFPDSEWTHRAYPYRLIG